MEPTLTPAALKHGVYSHSAEAMNQKLLEMVDEGFEHLDRTGLHVTTAEIRAWLEAVKTNPDAPEPVCHL